MGGPGPGPDEVLPLFDEGVDAVVAHGRAAPWDRPACGSWSAAEVARHVAAVIGWYHEWLDRALGGDADPPFPAAELAARNEDALRARSGQDPVDAGREFETSAADYRTRLLAHWDVPYGYPAGTVTAGLHAGVAAAEWHLHAWDLAQAAGADHRPRDPGALFRAAGLGVAAARGGATGAAQRRLVPLGASIGPWWQLRRASGRGPGARG